MGSLSTAHWLISSGVAASFLIDRVGPVLGIVRGVQNGSALHAVLSFLLPLYGIVYFLVARPWGRWTPFPPISRETQARS